MRQTNHTYSQSITRLIHSPSHVFTVNHIVLLAFNIAATTLEDVHPRRNLRPPHNYETLGVGSKTMLERSVLSSSFSLAHSTPLHKTARQPGSRRTAAPSVQLIASAAAVSAAQPAQSAASPTCEAEAWPGLKTTGTPNASRSSAA